MRPLTALRGLVKLARVKLDSFRVFFRFNLFGKLASNKSKNRAPPTEGARRRRTSGRKRAKREKLRTSKYDCPTFAAVTPKVAHFPSFFLPAPPHLCIHAYLTIKTEGLCTLACMSFPYSNITKSNRCFAYFASSWPKSRSEQVSTDTGAKPYPIFPLSYRKPIIFKTVHNISLKNIYFCNYEW